MTHTNLRINGIETKTQAKAWVFFMLIAVLGPSLPSIMFADVNKRPVVEELSKEEKVSMMKQLLEEGDRLVERKDYNLANATYESIFLIKPGHVEASKRIDRLKKRMVKEGVSETQLVTRVYDQEIEIRAKQYLNQAKELMKAGKLAQARFNLQKLLLINPLHEEANKLYKKLNQQLEHSA